MAITEDGSVYVVGTFAEEAIFRDDTHEVAVTAVGSEDAFIAKYSPLGELLWLQTLGGEGGDAALAVAPADDGVVVAGSFSGSIEVSTTVAGTQSLTSAGQGDAFIARFASDGTLVWIGAVGGLNDDSAYAVGTRPGGTVVVAGWSFGGLMPDDDSGEEGRHHAHQPQSFWAELDDAGRVLWQQQQTGEGSSRVFSLAECGEEGVFVVGTFSDTILVPAGNAAVQRLEAVGRDDVFVLNLDDVGSATWAIAAGGRDDDEARSVACRQDGGVVIAGYIQQEAQFGDITVVPDVPEGLAREDGFLAALDRSGRVQWARSTGGRGGDGVVVLPDGRIVAGGTLAGRSVASVVPASGWWEERSSGGVSQQVAVGSYDAEGRILWSLAFRGPGSWVTYGEQGEPGGVSAGAGGGATQWDRGDVAAGTDGAVVIVGTFDDWTHLENGQDRRCALEAQGGDSDWFVAYYQEVTQ